MKVGVLLRRAEGKRQPFGSATLFWRLLNRLGAAMGIDVVALAATDVARWPGLGKLAAWDCRFSKDDSHYRRRSQSPPRVVYDRLKGPAGDGARRALRSGGIPLLNSQTLDKWQSYRVLGRDRRIAPVLPDTELLTDWRQVLDMVARHGQAFLKPVQGSLGRGVLRVEGRGGLFFCSYGHPRTGRDRVAVCDRSRLRGWLEKRTDEQDYLVQQGLDLRVFGGRTTDVRLLVQKDGQGQWGVTGMAARVGASGRITSNLATGGRGLPITRLLSTMFPADADRQVTTHRQLSDLGLRICTTLERTTGPLGELGIDLGVDARGRIWYIEHNYYPFRDVFRQIRDHATYRLAHQRPLEYAAFLGQAAATNDDDHSGPISDRRTVTPFMPTDPHAPSAFPTPFVERNTPVASPGGSDALHVPRVYRFASGQDVAVLRQAWMAASRRGRDIDDD